jgi:uncharacterized membrane protein YoaK (UPF0700 family)
MIAETRATPVEETLLVALILTICGGYLDAFTWIAHDRVLANAQTANVVLFGVYAASGQWDDALRHLPPIVAFVVGVLVTLRLRDRFGGQIRTISLLVEIVVLTVALLLHVHLPLIAGTLGISFAAAMQTTSFAKAEGMAFSSVMTTGNLSRFAEAVHARARGDRSRRTTRQIFVFGAVAACFGLGAGIGAMATRALGSAGLVIPIALLATVLAICSLSGSGHIRIRRISIVANSKAPE